MKGLPTSKEKFCSVEK